jgi:hypothetical protein
MIKITKDTFQKLLLTELSGQSKMPGDLYIYVESLPLFLSTSIAFKIFNYQLRNFPRQVIWTAADERILHMMSLVDLPVKPHLTKEEILRFEQESSTPKRLTGEKQVSSVDNQKTNETSTTENFIETVVSKNEQKKQTALITSENKDQAKLSLKELFESADYNRSTLIDSEDLDSGILSKGKTLQDLDSWIDRIEATKKALNSMKGQDNLENDFIVESIENINPGNTPTFTSFLQFKKYKKQPKAYLFITSFFSFALIFIIGMVFFPTNAYTLEINSPSDSATINLSIPSTAFSKQAIKTSAITSIPTSGDNQNGSERATGKIDLINKSSKSVSLINGSFKLVKDGKVYTHLRNSTLPEQIILAPFNDLNPITITVQADELGSESNQSANSIFEILNVLDQKPCSSCFGIATSDIIAANISGKKIVTEADQSLLRANIDAILAQQKISKIQALKEDKAGIDDIVTNYDWYNNISSSYVFEPNLGDVSADTNLQSSVDTDIYYIPQAMLSDILVRENNAIDKVIEINILDSVGQFKDKVSDIKIKVNYKFTKKIDLDKKEIEKTITGNTDFINAKEKIQKDYQSIVNIDKKELGLKIPFLPPVTNIKYIQNN